MNVLVINGPNLDLLGTREPEIYGSTTLADLEAMIDKWATAMGITVESVQHNSETDIIATIHQFAGDALVINPAAFSHTSRAIADAITARGLVAVEVHISNIFDREAWRAHSVVSPACVRTIYGRGISGYRDALRHLSNRASSEFETIRYGPHADNVGDLRTASSDTLVVVAHGGLWRREYERDTTESIAVDATRRGHSSWNLEYRRSGNGGGWPASPHDVLTALDFIPQLGQEFERVLIVSHSAGSQLAAWAASRSHTQVAQHLGLGPLLDLEACVRDGETGADECAAMIDQGAPGDTLTGDIPTVLVHGTADEIVPADNVRAYADRHGIELHLTDTNHFSLLDPNSSEWRWATNRMGL